MKIKHSLYLSFSLIFFLVVVCPSQAQQGAESQRSMLPDIDPQDIEIRSDFQANFQGLTRQPILGFQPEDRIFQVDSGRTPFIESEEQRMAQLPVVELSRPDPPEMEFLGDPSARMLYTEIGYGSHQSPRVKAYAERKMSDHSRLTAHLEHHSSSGHLNRSFGAFRNLNANLGYSANLGSGRIKLNAGGETNFNNLYPLASGVSSEHYRNAFGGAHLTASYQAFTNSYEGWEIKSSYDFFETSSRVFDLSDQTREHNGMLKGAYQWTGNRLHELYRIDVMAKHGAFSGGQTGESWYQIGADFTYERLLNYELLLDGSVGIHGAEEPNGGKLLLPTSNIRAKYWVGNDLTLQATFETDLSGKSLKNRYQDNPFILAMRPQFANTYRIGGSLEMEYQPLNRLFLRVAGSYHYIRDYAYMDRGNKVSNLLSDIITSQPGTGSVLRNFYKTFYDDARIAELQLSLTHDLIPQTFWIDLSGTLRDHIIKEGSSDGIPYLSDYTLASSIFVKPVNSFRIRLWGEYVGPRPVSGGNTELDDYFTVNARFEMNVRERIGLFIEGKNILDQQYEVWEGYTARPLQLYGGATLSF